MLSNATHDRDVGVEMTQMVNEVRSPSLPLTAAQQGIWFHRDPSKDSLFGFCMFKLDDRRWFWYQRYHHLIVDGATMASITSRVASAYAAIDARRPVPASHARGVAELVSSNRAYRMSADYLRDRSFWKEMLKDRPQVHSLSHHGLAEARVISAT